MIIMDPYIYFIEVLIFSVRSSFSRLGRLADHEEEPVIGGADSRASKISSKKSRTTSQASKSRTEQASTPKSKDRQGAKSAGSSGCVSVLFLSSCKRLQ